MYKLVHNLHLIADAQRHHTIGNRDELSPNHIQDVVSCQTRILPQSHEEGE